MYKRHPTKQANSVDLIYSISQDEIKAQMQQRSSLESKANILLGFAGAIITLLVSSLNKINELNSKVQIFILIGLALFGASIVLTISVFIVRRYNFSINLSHLFENYVNTYSERTKRVLISTYIEDWEKNNKKLEGIASLIKAAIFFQALGLISLGFALFLSIVQ